MSPGVRVVERRNEHGATIVITALSLVALMGLSAIVVDLGNARQVRRQAQNTADAAALAAAQDLPVTADVVATAKAYALDNLGIPTSDWVGCSDSEALVRTPDTANSNTCISIDNSFSEVRVRLPQRTVGTYFGQVLGRSSISLSASANARAVLTSQDRIIPAAVTASDGTGNLCVENSGSDSDCDARTSGNFGSLESPRLNLWFPTSNEDPTGLAINYAMSLDHDIDLWGGGTATRVCDGDVRSPCSTSNTTSENDANHMRTYTGNAVPPVTEGFVTGFTASTTDNGNVQFCGRLARPDTTDANITDPRPGGSCTPGGPTIDVLGHTLNGRHVWHYLTPEARAVFYPGITTEEPTTHAQWAPGDALLECFIEGYHYDFTTGIETVPTCTGVDPDDLLQGGGDTAVWPIFEMEMVADPRFGVIPVLETWPSGGSTEVPVVRFLPEFIYRIYTSSTKVKGLDAWVTDPALIETEDGTPGFEFGFQSDPQINLVR